jgi:hypothetical protein
MVARSLPAFAKQFGGELGQAFFQQFNFTSQSAVWNFAASFLGATGDSL